MPYPSETSKHREVFEPYVQGNGLDIGFGGDPIRPSAITLDTDPHADCGSHPINIVGDAMTLPWFRDNALSYIYSSHCLEDLEDTEGALREWLRVVQVGGYLALLLPDQKRYLAYCKAARTQPNQGHKHASFGLQFVKAILAHIGSNEVVFEDDHLDGYNIAVVVRKIAPIARKP